jgi:peptidylprolyl isomerase
MKTGLLLAAAAGVLTAQTFDPKMPAGVPAVSGPVVELATMRYIDIQQGTGATAGPGQQYTVHYTGWLRDGRAFDSSIGKDPIQFVQGRRQVIAGWEMGFEGMKVGGKRRLFIPYEMAYGEKGRGSIPPKAELVFDVELMAVKDAPQISPAADLLEPLGELQAKARRLAEAIPADKYDWRPAPGVRSFKEVFLHIAYGTQLMMNIADGAAHDAVMKEIADNQQAEKQLLTKEQVIAAMDENLAAFRKALETATAGSLSRDIDFFGTQTTRRGVLANIDTHIAEHVGQAIAYARMNGIVPPWSQ